MTDPHRPTHPVGWLADARRDLHYALRTLARTPGFTFVAVLTLALGIGAVTLIYSVVHHVVIDPLPYRGADRLVNVVVENLETRRTRTTFTAAELLDFQEHSTAFEGVIGTLGFSARYETPEAVDYLRGVWVTPNFFKFMGLAPLFGRAIGEADGRPDAPPVVVLRHRAWISHFNADPNVIGRTILLDGQPRTVIGVMPPRFTWHAADVWLPKPLEQSAPDDGKTFRNFQARLKPGVTTGEAEAQLNVIAARHARQDPTRYPPNFQIRVINVIAYTVGGFSRVLYVTLAAVGLLMLIACCNVANMLLARATTREREMTVRAALGASRGRIVRQLLAESLVLAAAGAAGGCLLAYVGIGTLVALLPPSPLPGEIDIRLNAPVLAFSAAIAILCAVLFGIAPALYGARRDLVEGLKSGGRGLAGTRGALRHALVAFEIALSLVLLLGAGLLVRSFVALTRVELGVDTRYVLFAPIAFPPGQSTGADKQRFYQLALERLASLPGVEAVAAASHLPLLGGAETSVDLPGQPADPQRRAIVHVCTDAYFRVFGIRFVRGEGLPASSARDFPRVAVVNRTLAVEYFGGEDPIGKTIAFTSMPPQAGAAYTGLFEIVGVVEDVRNRRLDERPAPQVYLPGAAAGNWNALLAIRTSGDPMLSLNSIRRELAAVDRRGAMMQPARLEDILDRIVYAQPRFSLVVLGIFAAAGTLLVAIGVFSVMAYTVSRQTREIAVRMALGADRRHVSRVVLGLATKLTVVGAAVGLLASFATSRLLASQLWNTSPHDPVTIATAVSAIAFVAIAACYIPARRAMRIEPMTALRHD